MQMAFALKTYNILGCNEFGFILYLVVCLITGILSQEEIISGNSFYFLSMPTHVPVTNNSHAATRVVPN
jgi:hypothetical protein